MNRTQKMVRLAFFLALSVLLHYLEDAFIQLPSVAPGVKLGLANAVGLVALYFYSDKEFWTIGFLRVLLVALLRMGFGSGFLISLGGWLLSSLMVTLFHRFSSVSIFGLSVISAFFHGLGQLIVVAILYQSIYMINYLPILSYLGMISGYLLAAVTSEALKRLRFH